VGRGIGTVAGRRDGTGADGSDFGWREGCEVEAGVGRRVGKGVGGTDVGCREG
jgi:hypothetical protein